MDRPLSGRDIRDRSVLRIFETDQSQAPANGTAWDDNSYFSEPEFDGSEHSQHVHKTKVPGDSKKCPTFCFHIQGASDDRITCCLCKILTRAMEFLYT